MTVLLTVSALADLKAGQEFYHRQGEQLGDYFMDSLSADIDSLAWYGGLHSMRWGVTIGFYPRGFPYSIYYRLRGEVVEVRRILDCRQSLENTPGIARVD